MAKPSDYFLSDEENERIFVHTILPAEFGVGAGAGSASRPLPPASTTAERRRPVALFLVAQTGAGKSHIAPALLDALSGPLSATSSAPAHLVADVHKAYHPAYAGLLDDARHGRCLPSLPSAACGHDARKWLLRACQVAAQQGRDTLVESASRYPEDVEAMTSAFRAAGTGYRVAVVLLAVGRVPSRVGLVARFVDAQRQKAKEAKEASGTPSSAPTRAVIPPRLTPPRVHDESYAGVAALAALLDKEQEGGPAVDAVLVVRRNQRVAYERYAGRDQIGTWSGGSQATTSSQLAVATALSLERSRRTGIDDEIAALRADVRRLLHDEAIVAEDEKLRSSVTALAEEFEAGDQDEAGKGLPELYPLDIPALLDNLRQPWKSD